MHRGEGGIDIVGLAFCRKREEWIGLLKGEVEEAWRVRGKSNRKAGLADG